MPAAPKNPSAAPAASGKVGIPDLCCRGACTCSLVSVNAPASNASSYQEQPSRSRPWHCDPWRSCPRHYQRSCRGKGGLASRTVGYRTSDRRTSRPAVSRRSRTRMPSGEQADSVRQHAAGHTPQDAAPHATPNTPDRRMMYRPCPRIGFLAGCASSTNGEAVIHGMPCRDCSRDQRTLQQRG